MYNTLILSSGGSYIISIISCLNKLIEQNIIDINNIKTYHGTSAGSIIAFLLNIGLKPSSILKIIDKFDLKKIYDIKSEDIINIIENKGLLSTKKFASILSIALNCIYQIDNITFKELYDKTGKSLNVYTTNLTKQKCCIFNHINTPDFDVIKAIEMSCCIPIIFQQIEHEGDIYVDGALCAYIPTPIMTQEERNKTIGILLVNDKQNINYDYNDPLWLLYSLYISMSLYMRTSLKYIKRTKPYDMIIINSKMNLTMNDINNNDMIKYGNEAAETFIEYNKIKENSNNDILDNDIHKQVNENNNDS
mgnify:CR=1 FL=1